MKNFCLTLLVAGCLVCAGCGTLPKGLSFADKEKPENNWDGSGYKRPRATGTGIDPQAREIEERLGYSSQ